MTIWRMCIACWIPKATNTHTHTLSLSLSTYHTLTHNTHAHTHALSLSHTHARTHAHSRARTRTQSRVHTHTLTLTHTHNMQYLMLSRCNNGCTNAPVYYVIRTSLVLYIIHFRSYRLLFLQFYAPYCWSSFLL